MTSASDPASRPSRWRVLNYDTNAVGRGPMFVGLMVLLPLLLIFVLWAVLAPLNSAAIATGEIVLSSDRKTVQHLEGGLVTKIYVSENEWVEQNQPLLVVQDLAERSGIEALTVQLVNARALIARLTAEHDHLSEPDFDEITLNLTVNEATVDGFKRIHMGVFTNITQSMVSFAELSGSRKIQIGREIEGLDAQLIAKGKELELVRDEFAASQKLRTRGFSTDLQVNTLARTVAILEGEAGTLSASKARLDQSILDQDMEVFQHGSDRTSALLNELQEAQVHVENLHQELRTLWDRQERSVIRAPTSGRVLDMKVHTIGAVLSPGIPLMDIVPDNDDLIIEARVSPTDIDLVKPNVPAKVQLSAFSAKKVDKLDAIVQSVSGDILTDEASGERYFMARLRVDDDALKALPPDVVLSPGMPADVFIIAGERTLAQYLLSPILDATYRAFREN